MLKFHSRNKQHNNLWEKQTKTLKIRRRSEKVFPYSFRKHLMWIHVKKYKNEYKRMMQTRRYLHSNQKIIPRNCENESRWIVFDTLLLYLFLYVLGGFDEFFYREKWEQSEKLGISWRRTWNFRKIKP